MASRIRTLLSQAFRTAWLGPHFYYDLIRLARKGWPTLARVAFLAIVLVGLLVMDRTQGESVHFTQPAEFARRAQRFAILLIVLQYLLVLALLPVYVASCIVEEKENQTLESLTLTHLTDRELVLGKLGARLVHVAAFALAGFPLLAFMHLWGNVDASMLVYHEVHLFALLLSAGSLCISVSANSESVFQAISGSYGWIALLGFVSMAAAFALPWMCLGPLPRFNTRDPGSGEAHYWFPLFLLVSVHLFLTFLFISQTIARMEALRKEERKRPRKQTGALTLTDKRVISTKVGKRGQTKSRIHPGAWPVRGHALFWKECLMEGTEYSLRARWVFIGLAAVSAGAILFQVLHFLIPPRDEAGLGVRMMAYPLTFTAYFIALAVYALAVLFQMTMTVAAEREQGTLTFLLMIPEERVTILFAKWLGPWWRNWPILAICYLGVFLGFASGLYDWKAALFLIAAPWPLMLMLGGLALWLSVMCRRVLYANMAIVGSVAVLVLAHIAVGQPMLTEGAFYLYILGARTELSLMGATPLQALLLMLGHHAIFLMLAAAFLGHAFWIFGRRDRN
jgi:ABC-type transport system involved in multi-copper enzyme maturation permease subunit